SATPLTWWREKKAAIASLAEPARRVLAVPATRGHSQRLFSSAGNVVRENSQLAEPRARLIVGFLG
ncbi:unnamed protein product, partial [Sphacelaria rigidula]